MCSLADSSRRLVTAAIAGNPVRLPAAWPRYAEMGISRALSSTNPVVDIQQIIGRARCQAGIGSQFVTSADLRQCASIRR